MICTDKLVSCPIWGEPAIDLTNPPGIDGVEVNSPRAGGRYKISRTAIGMLEGWSVQDKVKLSRWIAEQNDFDDVPFLHTGNIKNIIIGRGKSPIERAEDLLSYFCKSHPAAGEYIDIPNNCNFEAYSFVRGLGTDRITRDWYDYTEILFIILAHSSSSSPQEVEYLLGYLEKRGLIDKSNIQTENCYTILVAPEGFAHVAERSNANASSSQVFVAMWFNPEMDPAFFDGIAPGIRNAGYEPLRLDKSEFTGNIDDEIIAKLRESRLVVADFSSERDKPRGGVYFEAGFGLALGVPVIWCCRKKDLDHIHFDVRQFNFIVWENPEELRDRLEKRIRAVAGRGPLSVQAES